MCNLVEVCTKLSLVFPVGSFHFYRNVKTKQSLKVLEQTAPLLDSLISISK